LKTLMQVSPVLCQSRIKTSGLSAFCPACSFLGHANLEKALRPTDFLA
jgi:hypothetical protein